MSSELEVCKGSKGVFLAAAWSDVCVLFQLGGEFIEDVNAFEQFQRRIFQRNPTIKFGSVIWIDALAAKNPPSAEARKKYQQITNSTEASTRAVVYITDGTGFIAATMRAILTGMNVIQRRSYPSKVASDPEQAIEWLSQQLPPNPQRGTVKELTEKFKTLLANYKKEKGLSSK